MLEWKIPPKKKKVVLFKKKIVLVNKLIIKKNVVRIPCKCVFILFRLTIEGACLKALCLRIMTKDICMSLESTVRNVMMVNKDTVIN